MALVPQPGESVALAVVPEGGDGAPTRGRRPTVLMGRTWVRGMEVKEQGGCGKARNWSVDRGNWHRMKSPSARAQSSGT